MASVHKIREGIFKISWNSEYGNYTQRYDNTFVVNVVLPDMAESSCKLSSKPPFQVLQMEILFASEFKPKNLDDINIVASQNGQNLTLGNLGNSRWTTTFNSSNNRRYYTDEFNFDIVIDLTFHSTILVKKESTHVLNHLLNLWNTKTLADIAFKFKDKIIPAHVLIVASGSPVLDAMFKHDFKEKLERTVHIRDIQSNVFEHLLRHIYTGDADLNNVNVAALLVAADKYGMDSLKEECGLRLSQDLAIENATQNLILAHLQNSPMLYASTLNFMAKNARAICSRKDWMGLIKKYPELGFTAMQVMVEPTHKNQHTKIDTDSDA